MKNMVVVLFISPTKIIVRKTMVLLSLAEGKNIIPMVLTASTNYLSVI